MEPKTTAMHSKCRSRTEAETGPCSSSLIKSFSDLESEELRGFMDLGFDFSEHPDSRLVEIVPGLRKLMMKSCGSSRNENPRADCGSKSRPYLSEAWEASMNKDTDMMKKKKMKKKKEWRIPCVRDESDMKASLRLWAFTVASTFR